MEKNNVLLPRTYWAYMLKNHWSKKMIVEMDLAVFNYVFEGQVPVFENWDDDTNAKMAQHFKVIRKYIDKNEKNYELMKLIRGIAL